MLGIRNYALCSLLLLAAVTTSCNQEKRAQRAARKEQRKAVHLFDTLYSYWADSVMENVPLETLVNVLLISDQDSLPEWMGSVGGSPLEDRSKGMRLVPDSVFLSGDALAKMDRCEYPHFIKDLVIHYSRSLKEFKGDVVLSTIAVSDAFNHELTGGFAEGEGAWAAAMRDGPAWDDGKDRAQIQLVDSLSEEQSAGRFQIIKSPGGDSLAKDLVSSADLVWVPAWDSSSHQAVEQLLRDESNRELLRTKVEKVLTLLDYVRPGLQYVNPAAPQWSMAQRKQSVEKGIEFLSENLWGLNLGLDTAFAEEVMMSSDTLKKIDAFISNAIRRRAFPGCQVLIARHGRIVFNKSFGHHTYSRKNKVQNGHLYDIASITKVAATTLLAMKMVDEGMIDLDEPIRKYFDPVDGATIGDLTVRKLLMHRTGLPAMGQLNKYVNIAKKGPLTNSPLFTTSADEQHDVPVAEGIWFDHKERDQLWYQAQKIPLGPEKYVYSDINMNVLFEIFNRLLADRFPADEVFQPFQRALNQWFYRPMGLVDLGFQAFSWAEDGRTIPTEQDRFLRRQLVDGYVHDPYAALMGGVAGNAGLFSTSHALATIGQLWLDEGRFGDTLLIEPETVREFRSTQPGGFRGLGFNKADPKGTFIIPDYAPLSLFGHTGFTGTCIWVDPQNDLVFVFLSNRVHPNANNKTMYRLKVRRWLLGTAYGALSVAEYR